MSVWDSGSPDSGLTKDSTKETDFVGGIRSESARTGGRARLPVETILSRGEEER